MRLIRTIVMTGCLGLLFAAPADAQTWMGGYVGGSIGTAGPRAPGSETVVFDTNLDGAFTDTVRTAGGADAFSPGFCRGIANSPAAAGGCTIEDDRRVGGGGRLGVDWQAGRIVLGGLVDVMGAGAADSVTAFSTTPAFYTFMRELRYAAGLRARAGVGSERILAYGTAGPAWGRVEQRFTTSNAVNTFVAVNQDDDEGREHVWGYQAGGGVEIRLAPRVSLTGEYLFTSLDNRDESTIRAQGPAPAANPFIVVNPSGTDLRRTASFDVWAVNLGLSYRF